MKRYNYARKLIEQWRYHLDVAESIKLFIAHWAHLHSGLYPVDHSTIESNEFNDVAMPLSHELSRLMLQGESDVLAIILSEFCKGDSKHQGYYPTPPEIGKLISGLLNAKESKRDTVTLYEPCCGSAGLVMEKIEHIYYQNLDADYPLGHVRLTVEDISATQCHAFFIQLLHKLQYLQSTGGKSSQIASVHIQQIDVITRRQGRVNYQLSGAQAK